MKKIVVIATVKNERDIIESFIRYTLAFCDLMLIYDDRSEDNTRAIIQNIIVEELPVVLESETDEYMHYEDVKKVLIRAAVEKYGADLVIPLDADEFLYHIDGVNPRDVLESLPDDVEYRLPWRSYIFEKDPPPGINNEFLPNNFTFHRKRFFDVAMGFAGTTLVSKYLLNIKLAEICIGAHFLLYPEEHRNTVEIVESQELVCAHYPIRNRKQIMTKFIPNWINIWTRAERGTKSWLNEQEKGKIFNEVKECGDVKYETMRKLSIEYGLYALKDKEEVERILVEKGDELLEYGPIDASFCVDKLKLRYTDNSDEDKLLIRSVLDRIDVAVTYLSEESKEKSEIIEKIAYYNELQERKINLLTRQLDIITRQINDNHNSHY